MNRMEIAEQIAAEERARTEKIMGREVFKASWERMVFCACLECPDVLMAYVAARRYLDTGNECGLDMGVPKL